MEKNASSHNTITNFTKKNKNNKYSSLHCLELMWYKTHMLNFIDMQFFGLFGFQFCLINREKRCWNRGMPVPTVCHVEDVYSLYKVK